jgi:hypothetical protein
MRNKRNVVTGLQNLPGHDIKFLSRRKILAYSRAVSDTDIHESLEKVVAFAISFL